ncbi:hypothetical protein [Nostoc favosum]|uniref:Uncharacterized protein n=1 Tax=Nostoc favosum CHAB5714 TaxID=2780399 RepID=A0ABS8IIH3_9NOSO|nr:hypothetical protein [Nostoc favosum]MCC5603616.1 hypothetical protein [Nostoc favosum CHAB5714]
MSTMVTELVVPLRGSKLRAASRREVRAIRRRRLLAVMQERQYNNWLKGIVAKW